MKKYVRWTFIDIMTKVPTYGNSLQILFCEIMLRIYINRRLLCMISTFKYLSKHLLQDGRKVWNFGGGARSTVSGGYNAPPPPQGRKQVWKSGGASSNGTPGTPRDNRPVKYCKITESSLICQLLWSELCQKIRLKQKLQSSFNSLKNSEIIRCLHSEFFLKIYRNNSFRQTASAIY